jgi:hypothetical protein
MGVLQQREKVLLSSLATRFNPTTFFATKTQIEFSCEGSDRDGGSGSQEHLAAGALGDVVRPLVYALNSYHAQDRRPYLVVVVVVADC